MNHELFSSMHDILDYIIAHYEQADENEQLEFCRHIQELKETNDYVMDHWVSFEEKLARFFEEHVHFETNDHHLSSLSVTAPIQKKEINESSTKQYNNVVTNKTTDHSSSSVQCNECDLYDLDNPNYEKAIGYYKLLMFKESSNIFSALLAEAPECNRARLYYGMCLLHLQKWDEAKRQFQLLTVLSDFPKWLALSYNALGCLQAIQCHMGEAEKLFRRAYQIYPEFEDALKNLECCTLGKDEISLYFGSTELISM